MARKRSECDQAAEGNPGKIKFMQVWNNLVERRLDWVPKAHMDSRSFSRLDAHLVRGDGYIWRHIC